MGDARRLDRLVARQHGAFNRAQAHGAGFDKDAILRHIRNGSWVRADESVYVLASTPQTWEQLIWVAVLSRPRAVLTHETAGGLLDLSGFPKSRPVLLLPRGSNVRSPMPGFWRVTSSTRLPPRRWDESR